MCKRGFRGCKKCGEETLRSGEFYLKVLQCCNLSTTSGSFLNLTPEEGLQEDTGGRRDRRPGREDCMKSKGTTRRVDKSVWY